MAARLPLSDDLRSQVDQITRTVGVAEALKLFGLVRTTLERARLGGNLDRATRERISIALEKLKSAPRHGDGTRFGDGTRYV